MAGDAEMDQATLKRLRKRDADRRFHRKKREHTKSRLQYLEDLAEQLREHDTSGCMDVLMKKLAEVEDQRDEYKRKVEAIEVIMGGGVPKTTGILPTPSDQVKLSTQPGSASKATGPSVTTPSPPTLPLPELSRPPNKSSLRYLQQGHVLDSYQPPIIPGAPLSSGDRTADSIDLDLANPNMMATSNPHRKMCECQQGGQNSSPLKPPNKWQLINQRLSQWMSDPAYYRLGESLIEQDLWHDTPIRAVVDGWASVERRGSFHPGWRLLRSIDELIFEQTCSKSDRLAVMFVMGLLLASHLNPSNSEAVSRLPTYYLEDVAPTEKGLHHSYAIEYFAWPGMRAKLIATEHRYCDNKFWMAFVRSLSLQWSQGLADCYMEKPDSGLYQITPTFYNSIMDVKRFTMGPDFFELFPELRADIPARDTIPKTMSADVFLAEKMASQKRRYMWQQYVQMQQQQQQQQQQQLQHLTSPAPQEQMRFSSMQSPASSSGAVEICGPSSVASQHGSSSDESLTDQLTSLQPVWSCSPEYTALFQSWAGPTSQVHPSSGVDGLMYLIGDG